LKFDINTPDIDLSIIEPKIQILRHQDQFMDADPNNSHFPLHSL